MGHTGGTSSNLAQQPDDSHQFSEQWNNLLWLSGNWNGQPLDMMLNSGATVCCLAKCCFETNQNLKKCNILPYLEPGLLDANGTLLKSYGIIKAPLTVCKPVISHTVEFIIVDSLLYSGILGLSFLSRFQTWDINNQNNTLFLNNFIVTVSTRKISAHFDSCQWIRSVSIPTFNWIAHFDWWSPSLWGLSSTESCTHTSLNPTP